MTRRERRGRTPKTCALCGEAGFICQSHIIPKFVGDRLRRASATGYLVNPAHASKRKQDILKIRLLCERCEGRFSKHENCFRNEIFEPFEKPESFDKPQSFAYGSSLELFVASLSWRILKADYGHARSARPDLALLIDEAEYRWREFLLGESQTNPYESHLLFLDGEDSDANSLGGSDWYRFLAVDHAIHTSKYRVLAYAKLPHMIVATSIYPTSMKGWKGTKIKESGRITTFQSVDDEAFKKFFAERAQYISSCPNLSVERSAERWEEVSRNPSRFLRSESSRIRLKERCRVLRKKIEGMPRSIRDLIEHAILGAVDDPDARDEHSQAVRWNGTHVALKLADLPHDELRGLDRVIKNVMHEASVTRKCARSVWKADTVWVVFMVFYDVARERRRSKIRDEIDDVLRQRGDAKTPIGVFAVNYEDGELSFESAFLVKAVRDRHDS